MMMMTVWIELTIFRLAFSCYGAFWMSYATIFIPGSGVIDSFGGNMDEFNQAISLYLITWFVITVLFMCVAFSWET